jgi:predicted DNA-binding transcriptional regulator AlpA
MATPNNSPGKLMTDREVAEVLNISLGTVRRRRFLRQPPEPVRIGGCVRYTQASIQELIENGRRCTAEER